jgi:hypothetical protein
MTGELKALAGLNTVRPYSSGLVPAGLSDPAPAFPFETEWNNAGKNWTAVRVSVTNTASGSTSKLADFQLGGASKASIDKNGKLDLASGVDFGGNLYFKGSYFSINTTAGGVNLYGSLLYGNGTTLRLGRLDWSGPVEDIAQTASSKIYWSAGGLGNSTVDSGIERDSAGVLKVTDGAGTLRDWKARRGSLSEYLDITEMSAPAAPAANTARLYVEDNGSGKTRLMVLFPTGAAQVLATEP